MNEQMLNELSRHQYQPGINPFGYKLKGTTVEEKYTELQALRAARDADIRAKLAAQ